MLGQTVIARVLNDDGVFCRVWINNGPADRLQSSLGGSSGRKVHGYCWLSLLKTQSARNCRIVIRNRPVARAVSKRRSGHLEERVSEKRTGWLICAESCRGQSELRTNRNRFKRLDDADDASRQLARSPQLDHCAAVPLLVQRASCNSTIGVF